MTASNEEQEKKTGRSDTLGVDASLDMHHVGRGRRHHRITRSHKSDLDDNALCIVMSPGSGWHQPDTHGRYCRPDFNAHPELLDAISDRYPSQMHMARNGDLDFMKDEGWSVASSQS